MDPIHARLRLSSMAPDVFKRADLLNRGLSAHQIKKAVQAGTLIRPRPGWYARADADPLLVTAVRKGGALSCVSALGKHGLWVPPGHSSLHVRASKHQKAHRRGYCQGYGEPQPVDSALDDIPLALLYAARCVSAEDWIVLADSAMNTHGWTVEELESKMPHIPWVVAKLLPLCDPLAQSGTESIARVRLRREGFKVVVQPKIAAFNGHADLRIGRLLIECDSRRWHDNPDNYHRDRRRAI